MIEECKKSELAVRYSIILDEVEYEVYGNDIQNCYKDGNIIGNFIAKEFKFTIEDIVDIKGKEFEVYYKINDIKQKIGTFITVDVDINDTLRTTEVYSLDFELKTQITYASTLLYENGDVTLFDVWQECCDMAGIENGMTTIPNGDFIVETDQFTGTGDTIHTVMCEIAKCTMDYVVIGSDDKAYLRLKTTTEYIIENYEELDDKRDTHFITKLIYGESSIEGQEGITFDQDLIDEYGEHKIVVNDNLFAYTQEKRQFFADANYDKIKLFGYSSFVAENTFMPYLQIGDIIKFRTRTGALVDSIVLKKEHKIESDSVTFKIEAPSIIDATVDYKKPDPIQVVANNAKIIADRANATVNIVTTKTESLEKEINNTYQDLNTKLEGYATNETISSITSQVEQIQTATDLNINVIKDIQENGVTTVKTTTGFVFNEDGLNISKTNSKVANVVDENGIKIIDKTGSTEEVLLEAGYNEELGESVVRSKNITVEKYLTIGKNSRFEDYLVTGTGCFYVGGGN